MERFERALLDRFFDQILPATLEPDLMTAFVVTHLLSGRPAFLRAVDLAARIAAVLPKPKSVDDRTLKEVSARYQCDELSRERFADPDMALRYLEERAGGRQLVLLDVGGYFASALRHIAENFSGRLLAVVEDTENGYRRYLEEGKPPCPVFSVARSPLKEPEDHLVGQSVVFSAEALLRGRDRVLQGGTAAVVGFGKLGSSIAQTLHAKHVQVTVYDRDPVRMAQALSKGFRTAATLAEALAGAGVVVCATGNRALSGGDFVSLRNGAYVASVTSWEDELDLGALAEVYERASVADHVTRYSVPGHYFYLLNGGNAVNFLHGASVGAFILLVQAEIVAAIGQAADRDREPGFYEVDHETRQMIARVWLRYFT